MTSLGGLGRRITETKYGRSNRKANPDMAQSLEDWIGEAPHLECDWEPLKTIYHRSLVDLAALRFSPLIAGGRSLPAGCRGHDDVRGTAPSPASRRTVRGLAATTLRCWAVAGTRLDDFGTRTGPDPADRAARWRRSRSGRTPVLRRRRRDPAVRDLLDEYERWTGDKALVKDLEDEARAAINWIDQYADLPATATFVQALHERPASRTRAGRTPELDLVRRRRLPSSQGDRELQGYA